MLQTVYFHSKFLFVAWAIIYKQKCLYIYMMYLDRINDLIKFELV